VEYRPEVLELPDGDFLEVFWGPERSGAVILLLHGLGGSIQSSYMPWLMQALTQAGFQGIALHFRSSGEQPNRLLRTYHAGETGDLNWLVGHLRKRFPERALGAVGFSLGGNVLLKWLGEGGALEAAVAVSVPYLLERTLQQLLRPQSKIYHDYLLRKLAAAALRKSSARPDFPVRPDAIRRLRTLLEFDQTLTAPLHGFSSVEHYYRSSSSRPFLRYITTPTLLIHAEDDPFMTPDVIPLQEELSPEVQLQTSACGGHVGFLHGESPQQIRGWLEERIPEFLQNALSFHPSFLHP